MPIIGIEKFEADLEEFTRRMIPEDVRLLVEAIAMHVLRGVIFRTPRDEGWARGGWQLSLGAPATGMTGREDRSGGATYGAALSALKSLLPFQTVYVVNNEPHILVLEDGLFTPPDPGPSKDKRPGRRGKILVRGGYSVQAPRGIVTVTIQEVSMMFP
jgi:hypothetical protein